LSNEPIVINGKFLSAKGTGVHRVARELVRALDDLLAESGDPRAWILAYPCDARERLALKHIQCVRVGCSTWQLWEQFELPWFARGKLLLGLCNMAPLAARRTVTLIHDAHVFLTPQSSSFAFNMWYGFALPRVGSAAARVATVSNFSRDQLVRFGIAEPAKISVIANGADHLLRIAPEQSIIRSLGLRTNRYVLAVGNGQKHKNLEVLFKAAAQWRVSDLKAVVVGNDDARVFAGRAEMRNVFFAGYRGDAELRALYEGAACLAFPSTTEGFGLPPLEAMTLGCPVLAAPCGALPETCGDAAIYLSPRDAPAWARAIERLIGDEGSQGRLIAKGLAHAARFRWKDSARQLLAVIDDAQAQRAFALRKRSS
jgi:glycosyltransferase involved in cell wall biosynthesis